ncbi:unnamed protein product, partial [Tetraodon nigroviridis]
LCGITRSLFISNARSACSDALVRQEGVTLCVNVSRQQPFPVDRAIERLQIPVSDDPSEDLHSHFDGCADAIQQEVLRGGRALVYCKNGRSRSAAVCIAYLMKHHRLSLTDALQKVKAARHVIEPNPGFLSQLRRFEEELKSK